MQRLTVPLSTAGLALLFAIVCSILGRCIIGTKHRQRSHLFRSNVTVIIVVAAYVLTPSIAGAVASAFPCQRLGSSSRRMVYALNVECGSGDHVSAVAVAVLMIAVAAPFGFIVVLLRHVRKLLSEHRDAAQEDVLDWEHEERKLVAFLAKSF